MSDEIKTTDTMISIHALREEGDTRIRRWRTGWRLFLSTPSARRATVSVQPFAVPAHPFLSTPSARRATRTAVGYRLKGIISIHALREEGDS